MYLKYIIVLYIEYILLINNNVFCTNTNESLSYSAEDDDEGIFGPLLEKWTFSYNQPGEFREKRVMVIPKTEGGFVASRIYVLNETRPGKIVNRPSVNPRPQTPMINGGDRISQQASPGREVSETDLYLLGAVEKLAYKIDIMEKRVRHLEEMLYFVVAGNKIDTEPCPDNFTRVGEGCYFFGERKFDWQVANKYCKRMKAQLVEFETLNEKTQVISNIQTWSHLKGRDYWTSGLNPGLLWIWGGSAKPVLNKQTSDEIQGNGRCLSLTYDPMYRKYNYRGQDCSKLQNFICELPDQTSTNEIKRISKTLFKN